MSFNKLCPDFILFSQVFTIIFLGGLLAKQHCIPTDSPDNPKCGLPESAASGSQNQDLASSCRHLGRFRPALF